MPLVSVILPTHNRAASLGAAITSVLHQSIDDLELIVVDDASVEDIASVCRRFADSRLRYLRRDVRGGAAAARNTGIAAALGEFLAFQDSDDEWLLDKLALQIAEMRAAGPTCGVVIVGMVRLRAADTLAFMLDAPGARDVSVAEILRGRISFPQTWLLRRELLSLDAFDESLTVLEDWDLLIRLAARTRVRQLPELLAVSLLSTDSLSRNRSDWPDWVAQVLERHATLIASRPELDAAAQYVLARCLLPDGRRREARRALRRSLRRRPGHIRAWVLWLLAHAPQPLVARLLARASRQSLTSRTPPLTTSPSDSGSA